MKINPFRQPPEAPARVEDNVARLAIPKPVHVWRPVSDEELTQAARAHRCASHGRSPRARVRRDEETGEAVFEGVCCRAAQDAIRARVSEQVAEDDPQRDDG